mgnify:CR=1 FL=1
MTKRDRKLLTVFLRKYFQIEKDENMEDDEIMECITTLVTAGIFHDVRSLQIVIGRKTGILIPKKMIDDTLFL